VRHVIETKLAENKARNEQREMAEKRQQILEIMEKRAQNSLLNASDEELQALLKQTQV
jgi:hypothetical protein